MAKCPKCLAKKGKRYCPALDTMICAPCCAEHRLGEIQCTPDCSHLAGEHFQHTRRQERAKASGRHFLQKLGKVFRYEDNFNFIFLLCSESYWWMKHHGDLDDRSLASALEDLVDSFSPIFVASSSTSALAIFLHDLMEKGSRHQGLLKGDFTAAKRLVAVAELGRHVASAGPKSQSFRESLGSYFDELDFEADLDYSPLEQLGQDPGTLPSPTLPSPPGFSPAMPPSATGFKESSSGLILPS